MTSSHLIDAEQLLADQLAQASPDLLRGLLSTFIAALMGAEADALCGAGYRERSDERSNQRNGYRHRDFDTRAATIDVAIPKLRQGSYFPDWLLQRRKRAERALTSVVATCYLLGVSTRRMERLVETLGVTKLSKSQVSIMAKELDEAVEAFRTRPLDAGPYTFLAADALVLKVREAGRVVGVHTLIATGVNAEGYREILGIQVTSAEDGAGWLAFFRDLVARGLSGVALVTSDAHAGLVAAIGATLPAAAWQRCRTHYAANHLAVVSASSTVMPPRMPSVMLSLAVTATCCRTAPPGPPLPHNPAGPPGPPAWPGAPAAPAPPLPNSRPPAPPAPPGVVALAPSPINGRPSSAWVGALITPSTICSAAAASAEAYAPAPVLKACTNRWW